MDVKSYLEKQKQRISEEARAVKDFSVFDFNYVPDEPVMRDECRHLIDAMLRFDVTGIPSHMAIIGSRGSGKTLTVKLLQRLMPDQTELSVQYVNCRTHNTSFKILAHLLGVQARGASLTELYDRFRGRFEKKTVVVLDEADLMSPKDRSREILYLLSRSDQPYMIIMLSNNPHLLKELDAATRSSLQAETIHFRNYDAMQIQRILHQRAQRGLHRWDQAALTKIAALTTSRTNADARVAIKTLYYNVTQSDQDVDTCFDKARRDIVIDMINDLSDANLLILRVASTATADFARDVYRRYCRLSQQQSNKPFSYVYFCSNLAYLQSIGLIALVSAKVGRTYAHRILLNFDADTLASIYKLRFES